MIGVGNRAVLPGLAAAAILAVWAMASVAAEDWQRITATTDNCVIDFPGRPEFTSSAKPSNQSEQRDWDYSPTRRETYHLTVFQRHRGALKGKSAAFYRQMIASIARATDCTVRGEHALSIVDHPGVEAMCDSNSGLVLTQLIDAVIIGDRLYMIVSAGPKGHEQSEAAQRFHNSFKLVEP